MSGDGEYTTREILLAAQRGMDELRAERDKLRTALEKLLRAEEKYVRDTGLPQPDDLIQVAVNEARALIGWSARGTGGADTSATSEGEQA